MTVRVTIDSFDSQEDGGPDAPQAQFKVEVHVDGKAPEVTWTNVLETVCSAVSDALQKELR